MFNFLKKKPADNTLTAPATGRLVPVEEVDDPVFAQKMMGDGFAVVPADGLVVSPLTGTVSSVFPTKHAIGLKADGGFDVIVHMGVDTVELNGAPFQVSVAEGEKIRRGDKLAQADLEYLAEHEKDASIIVVFPELAGKIDLQKQGQVTAGDEIGEVSPVK